MKFEVLLASKYLSSRTGKGLSVITWIALAGVIMGVMSLVVVLAVMSGFEHDLRAKMLGNNAHILIQVLDSEVSNEEFRSLQSKIENTKGVEAAMPVVYGQAFILSPAGGAEGVFVKGVDPKLVNKVLELDQFLEEKNWKDFKGKSAILGRTLADDLRLGPQSNFTLVLNRGDFSPLGLVPRMQRLQVVDVFHSGMSQYDSRHVYMPIELAESIFETKPQTYEVKTVDARLISQVKESLRESLPSGVRISDWISLNSGFLQALQLEKLVMGVILALIILVAAFNICGSLIMVVRDKTKDIAILKSMGAEDSSILQIFFLQGLFIGLVGTVVGLGLGVILSLVLRDYVKFPLDKAVYMIDTLPVDLRMTDIVGVAIGALIITFVATLYPAQLAAKILPTEGLKLDA